MKDFEVRDNTLNDIENITSKKYYDIELKDIYKFSFDELYQFLVQNTDYLSSIPYDNVEKIIITSILLNVCILTKDGTLYIDGIKESKNIKDIGELFRIGLYTISNDNKITFPFFDGFNYIFDKNYKFKKILASNSQVIGLTYNNTIKVMGFWEYALIDTNELFDIDDIGYLKNSNEIVIIKGKDKNKKAKVLFQERFIDPDKDVIYIDNYYRNVNLRN